MTPSNTPAQSGEPAFIKTFKDILGISHKAVGVLHKHLPGEIEWSDGTTLDTAMDRVIPKSYIKTSFGNPTLDTRVPSEKLVKDTLDDKSNVGHTHDASEVFYNEEGLPSMSLDTALSAINTFMTTTETALSGKAPLSHTHTISNVTGLSGVLNAKAGSLDGVSAGEPIYMEDVLQAGVVSVCHFTWRNNESIPLVDLFPTKPNSSKQVYLYPSSQTQELVSKNQIVVCTACMHASSIIVVVLFKG